MKKSRKGGCTQGCGGSSKLISSPLLMLRANVFLASLVFMVAALPALAGEYAVLASGRRIYADRHELSGDLVRLYNKNGVTELPASVVEAFEVEDYVPPPAAPAPEPQPSSGSKPPEPKTQDPKTLIRAAAQRSDAPPAFGTLMQSVAKVESGFNPKAVSPKGAIGVMQLMPDTARRLGADPHDTEQNIDAGAKLLRELLQKYDGDVVKALAAYNAGEAAVDRFQGVPPYSETQHYVNKVVRDYIRNGGQ
jgi:soluble lytic murein transglycosylase-like protein